MSPRSKTTLTEEFLTEEITVRGTTYKFREISGAAYEECIKLAENDQGEADLTTVLKLMIPEALIEPKLSAEQIYAKPLPVLRAIQEIVNRMHFRSEPTTNGTGKKESEEDEEERPGNESSPETS